FQVTTKTSHLQAVKRIFRYLKGQTKLGLWYPKVSSFDLEAYLDSDYVGANLDRKSTTGGLWYLKDSAFELEAYTDSDYAGSGLDMKSTTGGCQLLGCRLIS
nr:uncharacterized mitochondrial protein AtMg00810-like [Tanacetum cinerariifolium]